MSGISISGGLGTSWWSVPWRGDTKVPGPDPPTILKEEPEILMDE